MPTKKTKETPVKEAKVKEVSKTEEIVSSPVVTQPSKSIPKPVLFGVLTLLALTAVGVGLYNRFWPVATVNGKAISRLEYYKAMENQIGKQTLDNLITEQLVFDAAKKQGVTIEPNAIATEMDQLDKQLQTQGQNLDQALTAEGMTRADLEKQIMFKQLIETMGTGEINVTDEEISKFLTENKELLPKDKKADELKEMAKSELYNQQKNQNIRSWLSQLREGAVITYQ